MTLILIIILWLSTAYYYFKADFYRLQRDRALKELKAKRFKNRDLNHEIIIYSDCSVFERLN